jgi:hypothetical protein
MEMREENKGTNVLEKIKRFPIKFSSAIALNVKVKFPPVLN